jgi:hypothetical protein
MEDQPTLLVLAAGMGTRYGGLKQLEPMGPHGETILDYSVFDAIRAGFGKVVFVIRRDIELPFRNSVGKRYQAHIDIDYAFQDLEDLPGDHSVPEGRTKPWGTAQAILSARTVVTGNFAVINADDFYGADAYKVIGTYFHDCTRRGQAPLCMVGYSLDHTLSNHGSVNRGLCRQDGNLLQSVEEVIDVERDREGTILGTARNGKEEKLDPEALVSMNFWGFSDQVFNPLNRHFQDFLKYHSHALTEEFYIPSFVDDLINKEAAHCDLLQTSATWFGVTYPGDKPFVQKHLADLTAAGEYPSPLQA